MKFMNNTNNTVVKNSKIIILISTFFKVFFIRSKESVFWLTIFPTVLFIILTTIFGNMGENVELKVKILGRSGMLQKMFEQVKQLNVEFIDYDQEDLNNILNHFKHELERGNIDLIIVIPKGFDTQYTTALLLRKTKFFKAVPLEIYNVPIRDSSKLASDILKGMFESMGNFEKIEVVEHDLTEHKYNYNEFIYPGVIGMAILSTFLFGFMSELEYMKRKKIVRRFLVAPVNVNLIYVTSAIVNVSVLFLGVFLLSIFAYFKGVNVFSFMPSVVFNLLISSAVMISFTLVVMSFVKSPSGLFAFSQIFFQVQMFVGGFYIPLKFAHPIVKNIAKFMPITYTVDGMRKVISLNSFENNHILVPVLYILLCIILIAFRKKRLQLEN